MGRLGQTLREALPIVAIALAAAALTAWLHPRRPAWFLVEESGQWNLPVGEIAARFPAPGTIVWIDARSAAEFEKGHVPGAILLTEDGWGEQVAANIDRLQEAMGRPVIVYCDGSGCERSRHIAERLRQTVGLEPVYVLKGDWREAP
ncbi:MAG: rhodanese-like domain-containing protein [Verrucomicrobiae bacterium]|nr:rhodanese-like domain-containing protein [Verrucomicrobiae bacterium]MCP5540131.1 rhodanese-like domain-containing protein [Akkermansiaceae bacterium]